MVSNNQETHMFSDSNQNPMKFYQVMNQQKKMLDRLIRNQKDFKKMIKEQRKQYAINENIDLANIKYEGIENEQDGNQQQQGQGCDNIGYGGNQGDMEGLDGPYYITCHHKPESGELVLEQKPNSDRCWLAKKDSSEKQKWYRKTHNLGGQDVLEIRNARSKDWLETEVRQICITKFEHPWEGNCTDLVLRKYTGADEQRWLYHDNVHIFHYRDSRPIDIEGWRFNPNTPVNVALGVHDMKGQSWDFVKA